MSYDYAGGSPFKAVTLSFWAGLIEMLAGFLNLGFIIQFISKPVLAAFSNVVAIKVSEKPFIKLLKIYHLYLFKVVTACVKGFFGLKIQGRQFITVWRGLFDNIMDVNVFDTTTATICIIMLFCLKVKDFKVFKKYLLILSCRN